MAHVSLPSLRELADRVKAGDEPLFTLRQVAEITQNPYNTVRTWVYVYRWLPTVPAGPSCRPHVRGSVLVQLFWAGDSQAGRRCIES